MKLPGPDHPITMEPAGRRLRFVFRGRTVAVTAGALMVAEAGGLPVPYVPRADADMALLDRTLHATYCPYKGDASHFTLVVDGVRSLNAAWSYEHPYPALAAIAGFIAFDPDRVDAVEEG